jgi:general secretion pathway protein K
MPHSTLARRGAVQRGAAIITVMLVVAVVTLVVSGLFWRSHITVRSVENRLALTQTQWLQRGVLDWARVVLRLDALRPGPPIDHLNEIWAGPIEDTQLDETVLAGAKVVGDQGASAMLAGRIWDAQSRLNLTNLIDDPQGAWLEAFKELLDQLGLPGSLATVLHERLLRSATRIVGGATVESNSGLFPLFRVADLQMVPAFDDSVITVLEPYVIFLPVATTVNINTCDPLVLTAIVKGLNPGTARAFAGPQSRREFGSLSAAATALNFTAGFPGSAGNMLSVSTNFFLVRGVIRYQRVEALTETLMQRQSNKVEIVWQHRY